ncbi:unnamed protein product, partial [Effrenium voratum]
RCLQLWETGSRGSRHAMSRRFLDASWSGLPGEYEPPLRPFVEAMAAGESLLAGITDFEFRRWVSALTLIRVSERPAEGLHALVSRTLRRAPNATVSYVSNELRFKQLMSMIAQDP